jgi:UTP--glucose-1-phosphate uridylyltransferase
MSLEAAVDKMRREGVPEVSIDTFAHHYRQLESGERGLIREDEIEPIEELPDAGSLPDRDANALAKTVVIKLNGGLGTSMGMTGPKSLLQVKEGLTFLDITARQVLALRRAHEVRTPLVLMNSFRTRDATLEALRRYPDLPVEIPLDFVQGKVPKLRADDLEPVDWPADRELEWAPPGHGDLYPSLVASGMLAALLEAGYEYAFVANSDNLGAVVEPRILAWFAEQRLPFAMEVTDRLEADRKGGHLARRSGGGLVLREIAQTPDGDVDAFMDTHRHRYFNTNNLWISLRALDELQRTHGVVSLPMIVNRKTVDPGDASSPEVFQLETAMGAAIAAFEGSAAIRVPRARFIPVKTTDDLLILRSDAYVLTDAANVELAPGRDRPPAIALDKRHFKLLRDFDARFPAGSPSLVECDRLEVEGDVVFGREVLVRGTVRVESESGTLRVPDGAVLET